MKKSELKLQIQILKESNKCLRAELESLKSMNLTEFYKTIEIENRKSLWFERIDALIKDVINLTNELKQ